MWYSLVLFASVALVAVGNEDLREFEKLDSIYNESPCLQAGGLCVLAADCPKLHLARTKGLCAEQRARGVECCHALSTKETRCTKRGGECMPKSARCPDRLQFSRATDCLPDEKCCILVY